MFMLCFNNDSDKFAFRAIRSVFLHYPANRKGYKLLNLTNHSIFISRHVDFHENFFPYHENTSHNSSSSSSLDWLSFNDQKSFVNPISSTAKSNSSVNSPQIYGLRHKSLL